MNSKAEKRDGENQIVVPLHAEEFSVARERVATGRVRVSASTRNREEQVEQTVTWEEVEIERRPVGETVDRMPSLRHEGDTLVIPVVEEVLVVERRLVLKEEVRVRRVRKTRVHQQRVTLRQQEATIARFPAQDEGAAGDSGGRS